MSYTNQPGKYQELLILPGNNTLLDRLNKQRNQLHCMYHLHKLLDLFQFLPGNNILEYKSNRTLHLQHCNSLQDKLLDAQSFQDNSTQLGILNKQVKLQHQCTCLPHTLSFYESPPDNNKMAYKVSIQTIQFLRNSHQDILLEPHLGLQVLQGSSILQDSFYIDLLPLNYSFQLDKRLFNMLPPHNNNLLDTKCKQKLKQHYKILHYKLLVMLN